MREILFRGKRTDNGEWVEGDLLHYESGEMAICKGFSKYGYEATEIIGRYKVIPETVGQFTGLTDKNGVRIFEGDIVTGYFNHEKIVGYVFYGGSAQFFIQRDGIYGIGLNNSDCWLEVIGNIHDNPELLEGGGGDG